ncbi:phosphoribosyltransferase [Kitasatospora sp. NPDC048286]|uniref:phosphoribosyltransferase n=1 Tax=Kitasatospora sp. NPDC048286 TaxID=3364047 RepID=UPI00371755D8
MRFLDRSTAGHQLARRLAPLLNGPPDGGVVVLGLAPGGLPVAAEVAEALGAPLDATVVRPVAVRGHDRPVGAIADGDPPLFDRYTLRSLGVTAAELGASVKRERVEVHRREALYRQGRDRLPVEGRIAVLVSDGLTDALTTRAALHALAADRPERLIVAAPVGDARVAADLRHDADAVVCLHLPRYAHAAGPWYGEFHEVTDREAAVLLHRRTPPGDRPRAGRAPGHAARS